MLVLETMADFPFNSLERIIDLNISKNKIKFWYNDTFDKPLKHIQKFFFSQNRDIMAITPAMIEDFESWNNSLKRLDLSENTFVCDRNIELCIIYKMYQKIWKLLNLMGEMAIFVEKSLEICWFLFSIF